MTETHQSIDLKPDVRHFLIPFVIGILTIPLLGAGIPVIMHYRKKWKSLCCRITNSDLTLFDRDGHLTIPLADVLSCDVGYGRFHKRFGLGNLVIRHTGGESVMPGIPDPVPVAALIERGARSERERLKMREEIEKAPAPHPSGTLDRKNELVGLWQQGLLSEEDYRREIKKFE